MQPKSSIGAYTQFPGGFYKAKQVSMVLSEGKGVTCRNFFSSRVQAALLCSLTGVARMAGPTAGHALSGGLTVRCAGCAKTFR